MKRLQAFFKFWYRFIVGDDRHLAAGIVMALVITDAFTAAGLNVWVLFPVLITMCLLLSTRQAARKTRKQPRGPHHPAPLVVSWLQLWLPLALLALTPIADTYLKQLSVATAQDLVLPCALNLVAVAVIAGLFFRGFRRDPLPFFLASVFITVAVVIDYASNFNWALQAFSSIWPLPVLVGPFAPLYWIVAGYLMFQLGRWTARLLTAYHVQPGNVMLATTLAAAGVFLIQAVPAGIDLASAWPQFFYHPPVLAISKLSVAPSGYKPDIYYFLLEDDDSQMPLTNQPAFKNSLGQFLPGHGFYVVPNALSNYPNIESSAAATLSAGFLSDQTSNFSGARNQPIAAVNQTVKLAPVARRLEGVGYTLHVIGYPPSVSALVLAGHNYLLDSFSDSLLGGSLFAPVIQTGLSLGGVQLLGYQPNVTAMQQEFGQTESIGKRSSGGQFVFQDIPTLTNYAQFQAALSSIMTRSHGRDVIILQSGNATRGVVPSTKSLITAQDMRTWTPASLQDKYGQLAAYYIPGATPTQLTATANAVNVFRVVLNSNFSTRLNMLPACYYGYPQGLGYSFVFSNLGPRLTGHTNPSCPANGNFLHPGPTKLIQSTARRPPTSGLEGDDD